MGVVGESKRRGGKDLEREFLRNPLIEWKERGESSHRVRVCLWALTRMRYYTGKGVGLVGNRESLQSHLILPYASYRSNDQNP